MWLLSILSASTSDQINLGPALQQIGIGALIAVPAYVAAWKLWSDRQFKDRAIRDLQTERIAREKELSDRLAPLLATAAEVLSRAPHQFDEALSEAHSAIRSSEIDRAMDRVVRKLEQTVDRLKDES